MKSKERDLTQSQTRWVGNWCLYVAGYIKASWALAYIWCFIINDIDWHLVLGRLACWVIVASPLRYVTLHRWLTIMLTDLMSGQWWTCLLDCVSSINGYMSEITTNMVSSSGISGWMIQWVESRQNVPWETMWQNGKGMISGTERSGCESSFTTC